MNLDTFGLQSCTRCDLCGQHYGQDGQPPAWRRPSQKVNGEAYGLLKIDAYDLDSDGIDLLVLGEAPGENEDKDGRPFVGSSGQDLRTALQLAGLDQASVWITNTNKCRPPGNRKPSPAERLACATWLCLELDALKPKYVVCLGDTAMSMFFPSGKVKGKVGDWIGKRLPSEDDEAYGCYHPAARNPSQKALILPVLTMIAGKLGIEPPAREPVDYQVEEV